MGKTKRYGDRIRKSERFKTNEHHCINVSCGGKGVPENLIELRVMTHKALHDLFGNGLPHEIIRSCIKVLGKPFNEGLKKELLDVLNKYKGKEYKENTYYGDRPKHGPNGIALKSNQNNDGEDMIYEKRGKGSRKYKDTGREPRGVM